MRDWPIDRFVAWRAYVARSQAPSTVRELDARTTRWMRRKLNGGNMIGLGLLVNPPAAYASEIPETAK